MELGIKYRGITATTQHIDYIKQVMENNPADSRRALSKKLCEAWNWVQPNGTLRDMVCRGFLLELERAGHIKLPPQKCNPQNPFLRRKKPSEVNVDRSFLERKLSEITPLEIVQVRGTAEEKLYNGLIEHYHYLGYCHPVGQHLKYIIYTKKRPIGCISWSSAVRHIQCRDKYIGWRKREREKNLHLMAYNSRFLIMDWIRVPHLASHILGKIVKTVSKDWERIYKHPICYLETFVDTERFLGISYKAANWQYIGVTKGLGKDATTKVPNRSIKAVWGYPLRKDFREYLCK